MLLLLFAFFYVLSPISGGVKIKHKKGFKMIVFDTGSYLRQCIFVPWCRVQRSEFCDGL